MTVTAHDESDDFIQVYTCNVTKVMVFSIFKTNHHTSDESDGLFLKKFVVLFILYNIFETIFKKALVTTFSYTMLIKSSLSSYHHHHHHQPPWLRRVPPL